MDFDNVFNTREKTQLEKKLDAHDKTQYITTKVDKLCLLLMLTSGNFMTPSQPGTLAHPAPDCGSKSRGILHSHVEIVRINLGLNKIFFF